MARKAAGGARPDSDHDIFVVIEGLPRDPLARQREVLAPLLPELLRLPERLSVIAKTPRELLGDLTPLVVDVGVDGIALYGQPYFESLRSKVLRALRSAGLPLRLLTIIGARPQFIVAAAVSRALREHNAVCHRRCLCLAAAGGLQWRPMVLSG